MEKRVEPLAILARHYDPEHPVFRLLVVHSVLVARKALELARAYRDRHPEADIDFGFIEEAALLHDIGIRYCRSPEIHCRGDEPYIRHGVIGREILEREGLPRHALVCERHTGAGITAEEVRARGLPLPERDYMPVTVEEKCIAVADKLYSKLPDRLWIEKSPEEVRRELAKWGPEVVARWDRLWAEIAA